MYSRAVSVIPDAKTVPHTMQQVTKSSLNPQKQVK